MRLTKGLTLLRQSPYLRPPAQMLVRLAKAPDLGQDMMAQLRLGKQMAPETTCTAIQAIAFHQIAPICF
jgi:hypothetical protein